MASAFAVSSTTGFGVGSLKPKVISASIDRSPSFLFFPLLSFLPCFSPVSVIYSPSLINFSFPASHAGLFFFFFCQLEVFQPFFLSLDLPYSVVRGEEVAIKAVIFNYLNETQEVPSWFYFCLFVCLFVCYVYFCHLHVKWVINEPILPPSSRKKWLSRNLCAQIPTLRAAVTPMATTATQNNAAKRAKNKNTKTQKHKINAREYQEYRWNSASFRSLDGLLSLYVDSKTRSVFSEK